MAPGKLGRSWLTGSNLSVQVSSCESLRVRTIGPLEHTAILLAGSAAQVLVLMARVGLVAFEGRWGGGGQGPRLQVQLVPEHRDPAATFEGFCSPVLG